MSREVLVGNTEPDLLLRWYLCYRKAPLAEAVATAKASEIGLNAFPCALGEDHWHIGSASKLEKQSRGRLRASAKSRYRNDVRQGYLNWQGEKRPVPEGGLFPARWPSRESS